MGIQGVALEHHRDVPILRVQLVHEAIPDVDFPSVGFFEARDATEGGRLPATGRTEEDDEFLVLHLQVQVFHGHRAFEFFVQALDLDARQDARESSHSVIDFHRGGGSWPSGARRPFLFGLRVRWPRSHQARPSTAGTLLLSALTRTGRVRSRSPFGSSMYA